MSDWMDVLAFKQNSNGKWYATKLGSAKPSDKGGFDLYLDAIPAPTEGTYRISVRPRQERPQGQERPLSERASYGGGADPNDEIPFGPIR